MPIAFDPPAHAPHGNLHARPARAQDDDDGSVDMFTQLLLAAASVQDPAAPGEAGVRTAKDDVAAAADAPLLTLPLPPVNGLAAPAASSATDVQTDARVAAAGAGVRRALAAGRAVQAPVVAVAPSMPRALDEGAASASKTLASALSAEPTPRAEARPDNHAATQAGALPDAAAASASGTSAKTPASAPPAASALAALLAAPVVALSDKPSASKSELEAIAPAAQPPAAAGGAAAAPATLVETVAAPAFTPGWQDETVSKLAQIVLTRNERAELRLNPAELGPVHVRVEVHADQASVQIVAASPETRSALEQSLPQLRDLLAGQGITLGQASVSDGGAQRDARGDAWSSTRLATHDGGPAVPSDTVHLVVRQPNRLVDVFA